MHAAADRRVRWGQCVNAHGVTRIVLKGRMRNMDAAHHGLIAGLLKGEADLS
jgi:hypothetical protein